MNLEAKNTSRTYDTNKNHNCIDLVKFICALLVCAIHIAPFPDDSSEILHLLNFGLINYLCRLAVPFFFVASGFLFFRKIEAGNVDNNRLKNYCFNLLRLFGMWSIPLVVGGAYHLWYLKATVVAIFLIHTLLKHNLKHSYLIVVSIALYIIGLLGDSYYGITEILKQNSLFEFAANTYESFFEQTRNGLFMGTVFVLIGALFAHERIKINNIIASIGFVLSMVLLFVEVLLIKLYGSPKDYNMYIFLIPSVLFLFAIAAGINLKDRPIYKKLRVVGVIVYFSHMLVKKVLQLGFEIIYKFTNINCFPYLLILTIIFATALGFFIEFLSNTERFKWMRWLYK